MALTHFYAELLGVVIGLIALAMLANRRSMLEAIRELLADRAVLLLAAIVTLIVGLVVVLTHNVWSGSVLDILVTLLGWAMILRAVLLLFLPHASLQKLVSWVRLEQLYYVFGLVALLIGIYLAYYGFVG